MTKPAWFWLSRHDVTVPSVPQLNVWKLSRELRRKRLDVAGIGERIVRRRWRSQAPAHRVR